MNTEKHGFSVTNRHWGRHDPLARDDVFAAGRGLTIGHISEWPPSMTRVRVAGRPCEDE